MYIPTYTENNRSEHSTHLQKKWDANDSNTISVGDERYWKKVDWICQNADCNETEPGTDTDVWRTRPQMHATNQPLYPESFRTDYDDGVVSWFPAGDYIRANYSCPKGFFVNYPMSYLCLEKPGVSEDGDPGNDIVFRAEFTYFLNAEYQLSMINPSYAQQIDPADVGVSYLNGDQWLHYIFQNYGPTNDYVGRLGDMPYYEDNGEVYPSGWLIDTRSNYNYSTYQFENDFETIDSITTPPNERIFDTYDSAFDVVGVYDSLGNRVDGQSKEHAYLWQKDYHYRPGTLVTSAQLLYKCNELADGGDMCGQINPASLDYEKAWTLVESDMNELPFSERRYQSFYFDPSVEYSGHADFLSLVAADDTPDREEENTPLNDHLYFLPWANESVALTPPTVAARTQGARSRFKAVSGPPVEYGVANWAANAYTNEAVIYGDSVYLCLKDHEQEQSTAEYGMLCNNVVPGSYADKTMGVWERINTLPSRYEIEQKAITWVQGHIFFPGEYAIGSDDAVYQCKDWPTSEACSVYDPAGIAGHIAWTMTDIVRADTTNTTTSSNTGIVGETFDDTDEADLYEKYLPGDKTYGGIAIGNYYDKFTRTDMFDYEIQCYDFEEIKAAQRFFGLGDYACHKAEFLEAGSNFTTFFQYRVFECVSQFCSYNTPEYQLDSVDEHWRMTRASPLKVEIDQNLETKDCWEFEAGYPYMHGDFVCTDEMVWVCNWDNQNSTPAFAVNEEFSQENQNRVLTCKNNAPTYDVLGSAAFPWRTRTYKPNKVAAPAVQYKECIEWETTHPGHIVSSNGSDNSFRSTINEKNPYDFQMHRINRGDFVCYAGNVYECQHDNLCNAYRSTPLAETWEQHANHAVIDPERSWKLTRFIPKPMSLKEMYPVRRHVDCVMDFSTTLELYDGETEVFIADRNSEFNENYAHRYVPGDYVCTWDGSTGNFKVYQCPEAPAGNWCCAVDYLNRESSISRSNAFGSTTNVSQCLSYKEDKSNVDGVETSDLYEHIKLREKNLDPSTQDIDISRRDPVLHNWVEVTDEVIASPFASNNAFFITYSDRSVPNLDEYYFGNAGDDGFRNCYEWTYINEVEQTDPRYAPYMFEFGDYACDLQRVYRCLQPKYCNTRRPYEDNGSIWEITRFYSYYQTDLGEPADRVFRNLAQLSDLSTGVPAYKDADRDCDPQYCYTWENGVAWMPGDYACDASGILWQCNHRQDIAQHCTTVSPRYDSPDSLDEELVWSRVEMPSLPAAAPARQYRDCTIHDASDANAVYFWQVGDLACKDDSSRIWVCLHEERCNNQSPFADDLLPDTLQDGTVNPDDVDGDEPAWMLTHYSALSGNKKPLQKYSCVNHGATWNYEYNYLQGDCVIDSNNVVWVCQRPEICHLIDPDLDLFNFEDGTDANTSVQQRYGVGVWEPRHSLDTSTATIVNSQPHVADGGCFRADAFPPNEPFTNGDRVCVQPVSYGPYRSESGPTGDDFTFTWDPEEVVKTNNDGFRRVFECIGGDLCNKIYPLEDLYRDEPNYDNGDIYQFMGTTIPINVIEREDMNKEQQVKTGSASQTVWRLTRERFPLFSDERTAWQNTYDAFDDGTRDFTNNQLSADQKSNDRTQMTSAVTAVSAPGNVLPYEKNWWPLYSRDVYEWSQASTYNDGDFVYVKQSDWISATNHAKGDDIVWRCIFAPICNMAGPHDFYAAADLVHPLDGGLYEASIFFVVDYQEYDFDDLGTTGNDLESVSYSLWEVWERRMVEVPGTVLNDDNLGNNAVDAFIWGGPDNVFQVVTDGYMEAIEFTLGTRVCFSADPENVDYMVFECTQPEVCKFQAPYRLRPNEFIEEPEYGQDVQVFDSVLAYNYPTVIRDNAWAQTRLECNPVQPELTATVYNSANNYLVGDIVILTSGASAAYICRSKCDNNSPATAEVYEWYPIVESDTGYTINEIGYVAWDETTECQNLECVENNCNIFKVFPSPNLVPPNPETGARGGYLCYDGYVYECMHEVCNDPHRLGFQGITSTSWWEAFIDNFSPQEDWIVSLFAEPAAANNFYYPFGNRIWKKVNLLPASTIPDQPEDCIAWTEGYKFAEFDLACSRTTVYMCKDPLNCAIEDPRVDVLQQYWEVRTLSIPILRNVPTVPTLDCIDWDSSRFGEDFWYSGVRDGPAQTYRQYFYGPGAYSNIDDEGYTKNYGENNQKLIADGVSIDNGFGSMTQKALYLKEGDRVCRDGYVFEYTQAKQDLSFFIESTSENLRNSVTRNGYGAQFDTMNEPVLTGRRSLASIPAAYNVDWNILQAIPNPLVEERRQLPEVECTYWEPNRPYLSGDIVCRFEAENFASGPVARQYKLTAYMCAYNSPRPLNQVGQYDSDSIYVDAAFEHNAECSGPVWETQYNTFSDEDNAVDNLNAVALHGVSESWIALRATPVLKTERQYTPFQECIAPLADKNYVRRNLVDIESFENTDQQFDLPWSRQDIITGTQTTDPITCQATESKFYAFENAAFHAVPNWDQFCAQDDDKDFTTQYEGSDPIAYPNYIQPFRNHFNGDNEPQLCYRNRVYACTSSRRCNIYGDYAEEVTAAENIEGNLKIAIYQRRPVPINYLKTRYAPFYPSWNKMFIADDNTIDYYPLPSQLRLTSVNDDVPTDIDTNDPRIGFYIEFDEPALRDISTNSAANHDIQVFAYTAGAFAARHVETLGTTGNRWVELDAAFTQPNTLYEVQIALTNTDQYTGIKSNILKARTWPGIPNPLAQDGTDPLTTSDTINFAWGDYVESATFADGPETKTYDIVVVPFEPVDNADRVTDALGNFIPDQGRDVRQYLLDEYDANGNTVEGITTQNYEYSDGATGLPSNKIYCFEATAHNVGYDDGADQFIPFDNSFYRDDSITVNSDQIECYKTRTEQPVNLVCGPGTSTYEIDCTTDARVATDPQDGGTWTYEIEYALSKNQQKYFAYDDGDFRYAKQETAGVIVADDDGNNRFDLISESVWEVYSSTVSFATGVESFSIALDQGTDDVLINGVTVRVRSRSAQSTITPFTEPPVMYSDWTYSNQTRPTVPGNIRTATGQ